MEDTKEILKTLKEIKLDLDFLKKQFSLDSDDILALREAKSDYLEGKTKRI